MPSSPSGALAAHRVRDVGAHVAPLGDVARVAEAVHQLRPRACDAAGLPAELGRLAREAVARQGRQHQVECVLGGAAVRGRVGQRADGLEQLDDRAGPAMRHDQRQRVLMPRLTWMKWISTPSISVVNCGSAFSLASHLRQSYSLAQ